MAENEQATCRCVVCLQMCADAEQTPHTPAVYAVCLDAFGSFIYFFHLHFF
jgi:hypothetical protein